MLRQRRKQRETIGGRAIIGDRSRDCRTTQECEISFFKSIFRPPSPDRPPVHHSIITSVLLAVGLAARRVSSSHFREEHIDGVASRAQSIRRM